MIPRATSAPSPSYVTKHQIALISPPNSKLTIFSPCGSSHYIAIEAYDFAIEAAPLFKEAETPGRHRNRLA